jgi:hypothetical protein
MESKALIDEVDQAIKQRMQSATPVEKESAMMEIFKYFVNIDGIYGKTKITKAQRNMFYMYEVMHEKHPTWGLSNGAMKLAQILISEDGESRGQMVELWRGLLSQLRQESVSLDVGKQINESTKK